MIIFSILNCLKMMGHTNDLTEVKLTIIFIQIILKFIFKHPEHSHPRRQLKIHNKKIIELIIVQ